MTRDQLIKEARARATGLSFLLVYGLIILAMVGSAYLIL